MIKISNDSNIELTLQEYERLLKEWRASQMMTTNPQSFETWVQGVLKRG